MTIQYAAKNRNCNIASTPERGADFDAHQRPSVAAASDAHGLPLGLDPVKHRIIGEHFYGLPPSWASIGSLAARAVARIAVAGVPYV